MAPTTDGELPIPRFLANVDPRRLSPSEQREILALTADPLFRAALVVLVSLIKSLTNCKDPTNPKVLGLLLQGVGLAMSDPDDVWIEFVDDAYVKLCFARQSAYVLRVAPAVDFPIDEPVATLTVVRENLSAALRAMAPAVQQAVAAEARRSNAVLGPELQQLATPRAEPTASPQPLPSAGPASPQDPASGDQPTSGT